METARSICLFDALSALSLSAAGFLLDILTRRLDFAILPFAFPFLKLLCPMPKPRGRSACSPTGAELYRNETPKYWGA
jgi:hypothetical protein